MTEQLKLFIVASMTTAGEELLLGPWVCVACCGGCMDLPMSCCSDISLRYRLNRSAYVLVIGWERKAQAIKDSCFTSLCQQDERIVPC